MRLQGCVFLTGLLVLAALGCGSSANPPAAPVASQPADASAHRIVGQWHGEVWLDESQLSQVLAPEQIASLKTMAMDVRFDANGSMVLSGKNGDQPYSSQGRWEILSEEGPRVIIKSVESAGTEKEMMVRFDSDDVFSMSLPEPIARMGAMQFTRLR